MREVAIPESRLTTSTASVLACVATILELPFDAVPEPALNEDPAGGWTVSRWLGGFGLGIARIAAPELFSWPGPWIARVGASGVEGDRVDLGGSIGGRAAAIA